MANLLIVGLYLLLTGKAKVHCFAVGFVVTGLGTLVAFVIAALTKLDEFIFAGRKVHLLIESTVGHIPRFGGRDSVSAFANELLVGSQMFALPQVVLASVGGLVACLILRGGTRTSTPAGPATTTPVCSL